MSVDADYLAVYNAEHDTDFELYPGVVTLEGDGVVAIDAGLKSVKIGLSIARGEVEDVIEKIKLIYCHSLFPSKIPVWK